ncbi:DUF2199 domain-containing protein [Bacillus sp. REN10]|uniref:DUF2199 domain-containing protein n=1 Tax=Bacillus sp. REN10 TaxID=2782541 RepID=UPI00193B8439|nr:DUF2199 domain-containing protein [Bacillus sp. REN10]
MSNETGYICTSCGQYHAELPMSYGSPAPDYWFTIDPEERELRGELNSDICVIDDEYFFIRGCIEISVKGEEEPFVWNVWVSLSEASMHTTIDFWEEEGRENKVAPMFGWLSTSLPCYPDTLNLKAMVHTREVGMRPYIELEPTEHPLSMEQRIGMTMDRVQEIAEQLCSQDNEV